MKAGKAEEALGHYDKAVAKLPADAGVHFDRGAALYALSRFDEAGQEFLRATEAKEPALKASAFYNLGNAFFKKEKFKEAIEAYKRALGLEPRRQAGQVEPGARAQEEEGRGEEEAGRQEQGRQEQDKDDKNKDQKKDDKKDKQDKKDQKKDDKQDKKDQSRRTSRISRSRTSRTSQSPSPSKPEQNEEQQIQAVLDNLERSPKDLEKERARVRAVRRAPPERDW